MENVKQKAPVKLDVKAVKAVAGGLRVRSDVKAGLKFKPEIT